MIHPLAILTNPEIKTYPGKEKKKKRGNSEKMKDERTKAKNRKGKLITFSVNQEFWEVEKLWDELFDVSH